jgi:predicted metal-dependent HD superfamily phosphohydrolase
VPSGAFMKSDRSFFKIDENGLSFLRGQWWGILGRYSVDEAGKEGSFKLLAAKYSEPHRAYHNLSHIEALLRLSDSLKSKIQNYDIVSFSIWFHDLIYVTRKSDNEEKSAEIAVGSLTELNIPLETINTVRDFILATKDHSARDLSEDLKLFLDLDLSILGTPEEIYKKYSNAIRKEYSWVPGFLYRQSRKKILQNFLSRERIYLTEELFERFESAARKNIGSEIKDLTKK